MNKYLYKLAFNKVLLIHYEANQSEQVKINTFFLRYRSGALSSFRREVDIPDSAINKQCKTPIIIVISGDKVLDKIVDNSNSTSNLERIIGNPELLYYLNEDSSKISFIRKAELDNHLSKVVNNKKNIVIKTIVTKTFESYNINQFVNDSFNYSSFNMSGEKVELYFKIIYNKIFLPTLLFVLILLIANMFVFASYNNKIQIQATEKNALSSKLQQISEENVEDAGLGFPMVKTNKIRNSLIVSEIAKIIPSQITLTKLVLSPTLEENDRANKLSYQDKVIQISGTSESATAISNFSQNLSKLAFFESIKIKSIIYIEDKNLYEFDVAIETNL
ncbi:hypothetical protein SDC9_47247 [bioreactor metagenome]|uniref:Uncharacterized protein n=1 Tax=bioreactor metagenome TaxID=1076179 RepID=A0A644WB36_9ZZZZ